MGTSTPLVVAFFLVRVAGGVSPPQSGAFVEHSIQHIQCPNRVFIPSIEINKLCGHKLRDSERCEVTGMTYLVHRNDREEIWPRTVHLLDTTCVCYVGAVHATLACPVYVPILHPKEMQ